MTLVANSCAHCSAVTSASGARTPRPSGVDERVQPAEGVDDLGDGPLARCRVGDVADDGGRAIARLLGGVDEAIVSTCEKRDPRALLGEADADAAAEPG